MARELFTNNAKSTLASGITDSATSLAVQAGDGALYPDPGSDEFFYVTLDDGTNVEIVKCTSRSTDTLTVERAQQGTSASAFSAGDDVQLRFTAEPAEIIDVAALAGYNQYVPYQTGDAYTYPYYSGATAQGTGSDQLRAMPFYCVQTATFDRISMQVSSAGTGSALIRMGIYESGADGLAGSLLLDAGTVAADTTGVKSITISQELERGRIYWLAFLANESLSYRAITRGGPNVTMGLASEAGASNQRQHSLFKSQSFGALPDPYGSDTLSAASFDFPLITLRAA